MHQGGDGRPQVAGGWVADGALDEERLGRMGEQSAGAGRTCKVRARPAVASVAGGVGAGGVVPVQALQ